MQNKILISLIVVFIYSNFSAQNIDYVLLKDINNSYTTSGEKIQSVFSNSVTPIMIGVPAGILAYSLFKKGSIALNILSCRNS